MIDITGWEIINRLHHYEDMSYYHMGKERERKYDFEVSIYNTYLSEAKIAAFLINRAKERGAVDHVWSIPTPENKVIGIIDRAFGYMFAVMTHDGLALTSETTYPDIQSALLEGLEIHKNYDSRGTKEREEMKLSKGELDTIRVHEICRQFIYECLET